MDQNKTKTIKICERGKMFDHLMSRAQSRTLLEGTDGYTQLIFDFTDVNKVFPSAMDEIFRVFQLKRPNVKIDAINYTSEIEPWIKKARNAYKQYAKEHKC